MIIYYRPIILVLQLIKRYNNNMDKVILHCDLNNFYASVALKLHPEYEGYPLAVCGDPEKRHGVILAKNMLAKAAGVKTGEAIWVSKQKCPGLVPIKPDFPAYMKYSDAVKEIYKSYTDRVESFGIDECWLDVTDSIGLFGDGKTIADRLRAEIKEKFGLTISVGVSFTKVLAKLGSDLKKPDATTVLDRGHYMDVIGDMSPGELIMIGGKTLEKLKSLNIKTIRQLASADRELLRSKFGVIGDNMINAASGIEDEEVKRFDAVRIPKSVSNGTTTPRDISTFDEAKSVVYALCELIAMRLRKYNLAAEGIFLSVKYTNLKWVSRQRTLSRLTSNASDFAEASLALLKETHNFKAPLRAITVGAIRLNDKSQAQISLFDDEGEKEEKLEECVDKIRGKYGYHALKRGVILNTDLADNLHDDDGFVPFKR